MAENHIRSFSAKSGEFTARIFPEKFPEDKDADSTGREKIDRKFNIRIKQDDISLLDAIAKRKGVTRSALINKLLHETMLDVLQSFKDQDAQVYVAYVADQTASYDNVSQTWIQDILGSATDRIKWNILETSNEVGYPPEMNAPQGYRVLEEDYRSTAFLECREKLEGLLK